MTKLRPFQEIGVRWLHRFRGRAMLCDQMGLGKTIQALFYIKEAKIRPVVVVCPAIAKYHWEKEARDHIHMRAEVLEGQKPKTRAPLARSPIIIVNYDILQYWLKYLRKLRPQLVIVDECQAVKSLKAIRTKAVQKLCLGVPKVIGISGTPLVNRPSELFPIINIIKPETFPKWFPFAFKHCSPRRTRWGWEFKGATRLKLLHNKIKRFTIRRLKKNVLKELPDKTRDVITVSLDKPSEYRVAESDFKRWIRTRVGDRKTAKKALKAEALVKMGYLKRLAAKLKLRAVESWIDEFLASGKEKLIVFAIHKSIIAQLKERYGKSCVVIDGSVTGKRRQEAIHVFNTDKNKRILIGQIVAAGTAWSAKSCNTVLFAEVGWTPGEHTQAEDRIHGIGRGIGCGPRWIYYIIARDTIEARICELLDEKAKILDAVLDGKSKLDTNRDFDIASKLIQEFARGKAA